jgi:hypothetical protein
MSGNFPNTPGATVRTKVTGTTVDTKHGQDVYVLGGTVGTGGMLDGIIYDYVAVTYPDVDEEVYTFKTGGSGGTTVATITVLYTDATKANLLSATKV